MRRPVPHLVKKSLLLSGHATSVALEPLFWETLSRAARRDGETLHSLISRVDALEPEVPLTRKLRLAALNAALKGL
jgi:predicted DNA-binding ribbon-helix-helix protein